MGARRNASNKLQTGAGGIRLPPLSDIQVEALGRETGEPGWMVDDRRAAWQRYRRMPPPAADEPAWREGGAREFPFSELNLEALAVSGKGKRAPAGWLKPAAGADTGGQLLLEDRTTHTLILDETLARAGVVFLPLFQAAKERPELVRGVLGSIVPAETDVFAALASVVFDVGFFLHVPKGVRIAQPLHTLLWSSGEGLRAWRLLIHLDEGAEASLIHECASPERNPDAVRLDIVELIVGRGAALRFFLNQAWGGNIFRIGHERAVVDRGGTLTWGFAHIGARRAVTSAGVDLADKGASVRWSGIQFLNGKQSSVAKTIQNHAMPDTGSDFLCKSVLAGEARSHWQGMVRVAPEAAGSDGYQSSRYLLCSAKAKAEAVPGLEILSDDVRCTHGVTIGELDPEELFYLRSRGIAETEASRLLVGGFLEDALARIPEEAVRQRVHLAVDAKMKTMEEGTAAVVGKAARKDPEPEPRGALS